MRWEFRARLTVSMLLCLVMLTGCGSDDDSDTNATDPDPTGNQPPPAVDPGSDPGTGTNPDPDQNTAPTVSGTPPRSIVIGSTYRFTPKASDADGDMLLFKIENAPEWATFDSATGAMTGTPEEADVGIYSDIVISVTDGEATTQLPAFSIAVEAVATGTATLTWTAPTQRTDGSALTDLAGYRVYWGTQSRTYEHSAEIDNAGVTTYVIDNLGPGTHYFAVTAVSADGMESTRTSEASKTIQ